MYINKYYVREDLETPLLTEVSPYDFNTYLYCFNKIEEEWKESFPGIRICIFYDETGEIVAMRTTEKK